MDELKSILVVANRTSSDPGLLEKAARLARGCGARIYLFYIDVHAGGTLGLEKEPERAERLWQQHMDDHLTYLEALIAGLPARPVAMTAHVRCARPLSDAILATVAELQPQLIMKAPEGAHPLRLLTVSSNDWRLARRCPAALLLVAGQPWSPVPRFGALINVSAAAIARLPAAVLHACEYLALGCGGQVEAAYCESGHEPDEVAEGAAAFHSLVREFHLPADRVFALEGDPDSQLPAFAARQRYDVVAMGAPSHRHGLVALAGGLGSKLVDAVDCDLLLVRLPDGAAARRISARAAPESLPTAHRP